MAILPTDLLPIPAKPTKGTDVMATAVPL